MKYSSVAEAIPDSKIRSMMVRASEIPDVISFAVGEPDFAPPQAAIDATKAALDRHDTKYAPGAGVTELREVYADYIAKMTGVPYTAENIVVTAGGMASLFLGLMCMLDTDDEVLVSAPYFCNYHQMIAMCHGVPVPVDVYEKDDFILTPEAVEKALTPKTKVLMLNSPCNPTGGVISLDALKALAKLAIKHDLFVISDEVYRHILFDDAEYHSIASLPGMAERTLIVDSCSKTFSMTGFRVGFGAGPEHLTALMTKLTEGVYSNAVTFSQHGAIAAFQQALDHCEDMRQEFQRRRDYIVSRLNAMPGIHCIPPKGAFYVFANVGGTGLPAQDFSDQLLEQAHVAVVPGDNFGSMDGARYIRISYATSMENIKEGMDRMETFCKSIVN